MREEKYDVLRAFACMAVVLLHVSGSYWNVVDPGGNDFLAMTVYNGLSRFAVPVFMMLSGAFLLDPRKQMTIPDCLKRAGKMAVYFYCWSAFYAFQGIGMKWLRGEEITEELVRSSWQRFLWGADHMWFLFLVISFYLLLPVLRCICANRKVMVYYLAAWLAYSFGVNIIAGLPWIGWIGNRIAGMNITILTGYMGYFILGYYLKAFGLPAKWHKWVYAAGVCGAVYGTAAALAVSRSTGEADAAFFSPNTWNVLLFAAAVFLFFSGHEWNLGNFGRLSCRLASFSLSIYMVHVFFVEKLNLIGVRTTLFSAWVSVPLLTALVLLLSVLAAYLLELAAGWGRKLLK